MKLSYWLFSFGIVLWGCSKSHEKIVISYMDAHNNHDIDKSLDHLVEDIEFEMVETWTKKGKSEIRNLEEWDASVNGYLKFTNFKKNDEILTCRGMETNQWFKLTNIDTIFYEEIRFTLLNNKISKIRAQLDSASYHKINSVLMSIMRWASENKPEILLTLMPDNKFRYNFENGKKWISLLKEWRVATNKKDKD